jgi:hypothetical protein
MVALQNSPRRGLEFEKEGKPKPRKETRARGKENQSFGKEIQALSLGSIRLTYRPQDVGSGCDRPAHEQEARIEITPQMIEAGAAAIWDGFHDVVPYGSNTGRLWAKLVFEAMAKQMNSPCGGAP